MLHVVTTGAYYPPVVTTWKILTTGASQLTAGSLCIAPTSPQHLQLHKRRLLEKLCTQMIRKEKVCYFRFILFLNRFKKSNVEQKIFNIQITNRYSHNGFKVVTKSLNIPILFSNNYQGKYWFRNKHENGIMHCMHWLKDHTRPGEGEGAVFLNF